MLDPDVLQPSGAVLAANIALGAVIDRDAVAGLSHDTTTLDLLVRLELAPGRSLRAVEICRQLRLSASHVSRSIDKAVDAGLVVRASDPTDRRAKIVTLTKAGRGVVDAFAPRLESVLRSVIFDTLDPGGIETLVELLARVTRAAEERLDQSESHR